jgi:hypothetical protein
LNVLRYSSHRVQARWRIAPLRPLHAWLPFKGFDVSVFIDVLPAARGVVILGLVQHLEAIFPVGERTFKGTPAGPVGAPVEQALLDGVAQGIEPGRHRTRETRSGRFARALC